MSYSDDVRLNTLITDGKTVFHYIVQDVPRDRYFEQLTFPNFDMNAYVESFVDLTFVKLPRGTQPPTDDNVRDVCLKYLNLTWEGPRGGCYVFLEWFFASLEDIFASDKDAKQRAGDAHLLIILPPGNIRD